MAGRWLVYFEPSAFLRMPANGWMVATLVILMVPARLVSFDLDCVKRCCYTNYHQGQQQRHHQRRLIGSAADQRVSSNFIPVLATSD